MTLPGDCDPVNRVSPRWRLRIPVYRSIFSCGRCLGLGRNLATLRKRCVRAVESHDVASNLGEPEIHQLFPFGTNWPVPLGSR